VIIVVLQTVDGGPYQYRLDEEVDVVRGDGSDGWEVLEGMSPAEVEPYDYLAVDGALLEVASVWTMLKGGKINLLSARRFEV